MEKTLPTITSTNASLYKPTLQTKLALELVIFQPKESISYFFFNALKIKILDTQTTATNTQKLNKDNGLQALWTRTTGYNSTYPKGGVSCFKDSLVVNGSLVFQIKFCGKNPALRVAAKRWRPLQPTRQT